MNERREVWTRLHGPIPKGYVVHNLNGDARDNRPENLAAVPFKTDDINLIVAPYRIRIRELEKGISPKEK